MGQGRKEKHRFRAAKGWGSHNQFHNKEKCERGSTEAPVTGSRSTEIRRPALISVADQDPFRPTSQPIDPPLSAAGS